MLNLKNQKSQRAILLIIVILLVIGMIVPMLSAIL